MKRVAIVGAIAVGVLALPSSALAESDCNYAASQDFTNTTRAGAASLVVYADTSGNDAGTTGTAAVGAGACADGVAPSMGLDGGLAEVGAGEDPGTGTADPGLVTNQPDAYLVVDGSDANADPAGQSDGYIGVSNYETGGSRTGQANCTAGGPHNGAAGSSNSGGCIGLDGGPWIYVPADLPTPMCGNTSGNSFDGIGDEGAGNADGCLIPEDIGG